MSVVIAIKDNNKVYLAADTMVTFGDSKRHLRSLSTQKIWAVADTPNCIMGGAGYLRDINLVHYCTEELVPEINLIKGDINVGTIMMNVVPTIFNAIRDYGKITDSEDKPAASTFFWAYKDKLFSIFNDGNVEEVEDYEAIGSGADAALASLAHTQGLPIETRLLMALEAAADISLYVSDPYVFLDTENTELRTFDCIDNDDDGAETSEPEPEPEPMLDDLVYRPSK